MKKGFTLVEMLVVVVVVVTLMTMTFKLGSINGSSSKRTTTISRLQKLENCLSGYYAAFGTYPPVALHGSRNPFLTVSSHGIQNQDGKENKNIFGWDAEKFREWISSGRDGKYYQSDEDRAWDQVKAACQAQPVDCQYPFPDGYGEYVEAQSEIMREEAANSSSLSTSRKSVLIAGFDDGVSKNIGRFGSYRDKVDWRELQLFKFGLMSFLLPRYLVMMGADRSIYEDYSQWTGNNRLPCNPMTGLPFPSWGQVCNDSTSKQKSQLARVANIPSQAVCARWMPNLENIVYTPHWRKVFGIEIKEHNASGFSLTTCPIYSPGSFDEDSSSGQYMLDFCTVRDGWDNEFFYYSPAPHQNYVLWSSGPNERTFPPWISREGLGQRANECVGAWIDDDIVNMSH